MPKLDVFTRNRISQFVEKFRIHSGQLPTLRDFEEAGITRDRVELAIKGELLEQFYVTLSNNSVVKVFKIRVR